MIIPANTLSNYIKIDCSFNYLSLWAIPFHLGDSNYSYTAFIELNSSFSQVYQKELTNSLIVDGHNDLYQSVELFTGNSMSNENAVNTTFKFIQQIDKEISLRYYFPFKNETKFYSTLGFAFSFEDDNFSITHQFKKKGLINSLSFALAMAIPNTTHLYFGGIPPDIIDNQSHSYFNVIGYSNKWDFTISEVFLTKGTRKARYDTRRYSYLISSVEYIYTPKDFFDIIIEFYLREIAIEKICNIENTSPKRYLLCIDNPVLKQGKISFIIDDYVYLFQLERFWRCKKNHLCMLSLKENSNKDEWAIGHYFYQSFNLVFEYEEKRVHLYGSKEVQISQCQNNKYSINKIKLIFIFDLIWLFFGIGLVITIRQKVHNIK